MISESMKVVFQFFVNILTYDHLYDYDGPTISMHLCLKINKSPTIQRHHKQFGPT